MTKAGCQRSMPLVQINNLKNFISFCNHNNLCSHAYSVYLNICGIYKNEYFTAQELFFNNSVDLMELLVMF